MNIPSKNFSFSAFLSFLSERAASIFWFMFPSAAFYIGMKYLFLQPGLLSAVFLPVLAYIFPSYEQFLNNIKTAQEAGGLYQFLIQPENQTIVTGKLIPFALISFTLVMIAASVYVTLNFAFIANIGSKRPLLAIKIDKLPRVFLLTLMTVLCFVLPLWIVPYTILSYTWITILSLLALATGWSMYVHLYSAVFFAYETNEKISNCIKDSYQVMQGSMLKFIGYVCLLGMIFGLFSNLVFTLTHLFLSPLAASTIYAFVISLTSTLSSLFWYNWYKQRSE